MLEVNSLSSMLEVTKTLSEISVCMKLPCKTDIHNKRRKVTLIIPGGQWDSSGCRANLSTANGQVQVTELEGPTVELGGGPVCIPHCHGSAVQTHMEQTKIQETVQKLASSSLSQNILKRKANNKMFGAQLTALFHY